MVNRRRENRFVLYTRLDRLVEHRKKVMNGVVENQIRQMARERRKLAEHLRFFDCSIWLGRPQGFPLAEELLPEKIEETLRGRLVTGGMVSHWRGKTLSAQDGNRSLENTLPAQSENIRAIWTALPLFPAERGPLPGMGDLPASVRGARIFPRSHNFPLESWVVGSLCEWLIQHRMPLFIWHTELDWVRLRELAKTFKELSIVVETQMQKILYHTRPLFAVMHDCHNLRVEISNFAGAGFIEYAARQLGAERLIFGSFLPVSDPLVPMGMVLDADISQSEKALIAGDNIRRLIEQVRSYE